ncbi:hypothetical protein DFH07DRAFT_774773 [Mycena maculata]|uniref:Nephrocystin 3-like N-terminal domain-containing protein n=1 Tax=Mycena maculata TaxID=230809 RepID=A0AAD7N9L6_9AGAR|nr:hypothetical protein DFH07DRAFT_774773 [Mycena maculata]
MCAIRSKLEHKFLESPKTKECLKTACSGLSTILGVTKDVASNAGIPGLAMGITGGQFIVDAILKTAQNAEDIEELSKTLDKFSTETKRFQSQNFAMCSLNFTKDSERLKGQIQAVTWAIESFTEHINFSRDNARVVIQKLDGIESKVDIGSTQGIESGRAKMDTPRMPWRLLLIPRNGNVARRLHVPPFSPKYFSIETGSSGQSQQMIFWLNGAAGTGKTTIAYTIAQECKNGGILGASFFCSRDDADCSNLRLIFTTIAYQLGLFNPVFGTEVSKVLKATPDIGYTNAQTQLEELIVNPLHMVRDSFTRCVIILDALDDSVILSVLARHSEDLSPLIFLVTSRPENHIKMAFSQHLQPNTQQLILHHGSGRARH